MALAPGTYPYTITATRADGVTNTASGTVTVGAGAPEGVVTQLGTIAESQSLHPISTEVEVGIVAQLSPITNTQTIHTMATVVEEAPMPVNVNGTDYFPSADGKIYGQYPAGDAPVGATLPTYADRTKLVTTSAAGGGDGSEGSPWTLTEAMASAVAGDIVGIDEGIYTGTSGSYFDPAFEPTNSGTAGSPIVFVAKNPAATNTTNLTEIRSGATTQGTGRAAFGAVGQDYIYFIGFRSDNTVANNKTAVDLGACMLWNTTGSKAMQCEFVGESGISDNYSGIRLEITDGAECADNVISGYSNDTNSAGILVYKSNSFSLHHNTISNCNNGVQLKGADGADTINNIEVYLNLIHDCSNAFRLHGPVKGPSSELNLIYQNICYNNANSFEFTSSSTHTGEQDGLRVFNNVFYNTSDGDIWVNHNYDAGRDNAFFNNIFRTTAAYLRGTYTGASDVTHHQNFADYERNCISGATTFGNGTSSSALDSLTFNDWQTTYSEDANSTTSDPLFTNEVAQDFTLQGGSPCIGLGRDRLGKFGAVDATIDAGVYVSGSEVVGVRT